MSRTDRIMGMLLGHLVGDALGSGYEFGKAFASDHADPVMRTGVFGHPKGSGTDDTDVLRCCARTVIESSEIGVGFSPAIYANHLANWKATGPKDIGGQTSRAIRTWVATNKPPRRDETAQGNGALMGCAPLAVLREQEASVDKAIALSLTTHPSQASMEACSAYVSELWAIINGAEPTRAIWDLTDTDKAKAWSPTGPSIGWVTGALRIAHHAAVQARFDKTPTRALLDVVRQGGDTDTNAAIAGALLGAEHGPDAFAEIAGDLLTSERVTNEGLALQLAAL